MKKYVPYIFEILTFVAMHVSKPLCKGDRLFAADRNILKTFRCTIMNAVKILPPCLCLFFLPKDILSQAKIFGSIQLEDGDKAAGAIIHLLKSDSTSLLSYSISDTTGYWSIHGVDTGRHFVKILYLGCEPWQRPIIVKGEEEYEINAVIKYKQETLEDVEIVSDQLALIIKGDTLHYNISLYIDSTEHTLGDILQKLPQINVDQNGGISFKGQRINVVLTEGKDIFGSLHKQMTEGIKASDVKGIQIIENYKEGFDNIKAGKEEKTALNVTLTENAKNKPSGSIRGVTNLVNGYEVQGTAYKSSKNIGYTGMLRLNNVARPIISPLDLISLIDFENLKVEGSAKMEDLLPQSFIIPVDTKRSNDAFASLRLVAQPSENITLKSIIYFTGSNRYSERLVTRRYLDSTIFSGTNTSRTPTEVFYSDFKIDYKYKRRVYVSLHIPVTITQNERFDFLEGRLNTILSVNDFHVIKSATVFTPGAKLGYALNNFNTVSIELKSNFYKTHKSFFVKSVTPLFGTLDSSITQKNNNKNNFTEIMLALQSKHKRHIFTYTLGLDQSTYNLDIRADSIQKNYWNLTSHISGAQFYGDIQARYEGKKMRYHVSAKAANLKRKHDGIIKYNFFLPSSTAGFYCDFNRLNRLYINTGLFSQPADLSGLIRVPQIIDAQTVKTENIDSFYISNREYVDVAYMISEATGKYDFRLNYKLSKQKNSISYQTNIVNDFFTASSFLVPNILTNNLSVNFSKRFKKLRAKLSIIPGADVIKTYTLNQNNLFLTNVKNAYADASIHLSAIRTVLIIPGVRVEHSTQSTPAFNFGSNYQTNKFYLNCQYKSSKLFAKTLFAYQKQFTQQQSQNFWTLDFEIEYTHAKIPFKLNLVGQNILNFDGISMLMPDFNTNYIGYESFNTIGGRIMAGLTYSF